MLLSAITAPVNSLNECIRFSHFAQSVASVGISGAPLPTFTLAVRRKAELMGLPIPEHYLKEVETTLLMACDQLLVFDLPGYEWDATVVNQRLKAKAAGIATAPASLVLPKEATEALSLKLEGDLD